MTKRPWFPTIYAETCDGCTGAYKYVHYFPHDVLAIRDAAALIAQPLNCIDGCSACVGICTKGAIRFPAPGTAAGAMKKATSLHRIVCKGCGRGVSTNRDTEYCFDCEAQCDHPQQLILGGVRRWRSTAC